MKTHLKVINDDDIELIINGLEVLKKINNACYGVINPLAIAPHAAGAIPTYRVSHATDWLKIAKVLYTNATANIFENCRIKVGNNPGLITIEDHFDRKVLFPQNHNSYPAITQKIQAILQETGLTDAELAEALYKRTKNPTTPYRQELSAAARRNYLDALLVLLCIIEPSRHFPMAAYATMLFDLIQNPHPRRPLKWSNVFVSEKGYAWDDFESKGYGGRYPGASNSSGSGNFAEAVNIFRQWPPTASNLTRITQQRQHHAALVRGMTFVFYWLDIIDHDFLKTAATKNELLGKINKLIIRNLVYTFRIPNTSGLDKIELEGLPAPLNIPLGNLNLGLNDDELCYYYKHTDISSDNDADKNKQNIFFHRANYACKLVSEYSREEREKGINEDNVARTIHSTLTLTTVNHAQQEEALQSCSCCYKPNNQNKFPPIIAVKDTADLAIYHWPSLNSICYGNALENDNVKVKSLHVAKKNNTPSCNTCWPAPPPAPIDKFIITIGN